MAIALDGSLSGSSMASIPSTPSLSSTPLVTPSNGQGSDSSVGSAKPPSVRSASINNGVKVANVSPSPAATEKLVLSTTHTSAQSSAKSIASSDNQTISLSRPATLTHAALSSTHSGPVVAVSTSPTKASSSSKAPLTASPNPSSTAHQSSKSTKIANISPNVSANATTSKSSSAKSLTQSLATGAANVTHASTTPVFVPQVSTSDTLPFTSTTLVPSPTFSLGNLAKSSGFFSNRAAVGGVFFVVALAVLGLAGLIIFGIRRYRRLRSDGYIREPILPDVDPSSNGGDMHYQRASQMRGLRDAVSGGASGPMPSSRRSITSDDSHTFSRDTHHSDSPIMPPYLNRSANHHVDVHPSRDIEGHTNGYQNLIPFPPASKPFAQKSQVSVQSAVETSPSIYPPTLPSVADEDEERYWRQHGFDRVSHSQDADKMIEKHVPVQQPTPTDSALGLWTDTSPTDSRGPSTLENELVRSMDSRMEPTSVHKGSTAPIAVPPRLHLQDGRYPVVGSYTPAYRPPW